MRSFEEILAISAERKGGMEAVMADIDPPLSHAELSYVPDDRWLSLMTRGVFQAGFKGFDVGKCAMMDDVWFDQLITDTNIVRNGSKIKTVQENAVFVEETSLKSGGFGRFIADWPDDDFAGLLMLLKSEGSRLGGTTGQYLLRSSGKDSFILSRDVVARLIAEGVIDKSPTSKRALNAVQAAFNTWRDQSGQSFNVISRILAQSIG